MAKPKLGFVCLDPFVRYFELLTPYLASILSSIVNKKSVIMVRGTGKFPVYSTYFSAHFEPQVNSSRNVVAVEISGVQRRSRLMDTYLIDFDSKNMVLDENGTAVSTDKRW